jgi:glycosyltransferase involved in cell wall biosynthesis
VNVILTHLPPKPGSDSKLYAGRPIVTFDLIEAFLRYTRDIRFIAYTPHSLKNQYQKYKNDYSNSDKLELMDAATIKQSIGLHEPTVIHTFTASLRYGFHLRWLCGSRRWPVVGMTHDLSSYEVFEELLLAHLASPAPYDAIVCTTKCARTVLENLIENVSTTIGCESKLQLPIIPLGVEPASFTSSDRRSVRRNLQLDNSRPVLLYLGRISRTMKADLIPLLTAVSRLSCINSPMLIIAGGVLSSREEESVEQIKNYIIELELNNDVRILTNITQQQRLELLSAADMLVSPADSYQETFGLVLLEAMAAGIPVIASDWDGYREVIEESKTGLLVETIMPSDGLEEISAGMLFEDRMWWYGEFSQSVAINMDQLVIAMTKLINDPDLRRRMGLAGRERVQKYFAWNHIVATYEQEWKRLISIAAESVYTIGASPYSYIHAEAFRLHPTKKFDSNTLVRRSLQHASTSFPVENPPLFLSSSTLQDILHAIEHPVRIRDIEVKRPKLSRHIAYLLKQGIAEIVDE